MALKRLFRSIKPFYDKIFSLVPVLFAVVDLKHAAVKA
ncbi:MAG: hypothetical protein BWX80_01897 [Candidatus Hydrogenedentes bacterium ADurb.Bin101]|nr:MAG: hypothetical protein BWX80_01897 [Candidatus Hydrogenedentes bacterium ADurb.Bin101]